LKASEIDWTPGQVTLWDLDSVDSKVPLSQQLSELHEDLALISYPDNVWVDVGWYPEFSKDGAFTILVIRNNDWENPASEERSATVEGLRGALIKATVIARG